MTTAQSGIADRLRAVASRDDLHAALLTLTVGGESRWTRTQVLYFLPMAWRAAAAAYFDGERLRAPDAWPPAPVTRDAGTIADALARARAVLGDAEQPNDATDDALPPRTPALAAILATSEPVGDAPVPQMLRALRDEMRAADARQPKRFRLSKGRCVRAVDGQFVYQFTWSSEPDPNVPGELRVGKELAPARVGEGVPDEGAIRYELVVDAWFGPEVDSAVFRVDPTFLLRELYCQLRDRDAAAPDAGTWAARLTSAPEQGDASPAAVPAHATLNGRQRRALHTARHATRAYVWGPPGTGKTTTVGALVRDLAGAGRRVLVVSPYNVAVDEALLAVHRADGPPLRALRLGRAGEAVRRVGLDLDSQLERRAAGDGTLAVAQDLVAAVNARQPGERVSLPSTVRACLDELGAFVVRRRAARGDREAQELVHRIWQLRERFRAPRGDLLRDAHVVGCTMALSFLASDLFSQPFDHLIVDEASVVRAPEAVLAALRAGAPVTFFGDPKQLPSIVLADTARVGRWVAPSPFALAGVSKPADAVGTCVMLDEQHRMAPPIRSLVSELFYDGALRDGSQAPATGRVLVVDTGRSGARSTPKMIKLSNSKENQVHRDVVAEVLRAVARGDADARALVLSPFAAQKRAYRRERTTAGALRNVRFETVHTSQGTEQDLVVLDLVLAGQGTGVKSRMLDERANRHLPNLLNVALSRARRTLVIVADLALVKREYHGGLLADLLARASAAGVRVEVVPGLVGLRPALAAALADSV